MSFTRFAVYYLPPEGALAAFGAAWLGWDVTRACETPQPDLPRIEHATKTPRKYGFHATLKPPFHMTEGYREADLQAAVAEMAAGCAPARSDGLRLSRLGRFLALTPEGDGADLARVAAACVSELDAFRAPASADEMARRRTARLTDQQDALLLRWGYPYVMDAFRFHMTLTGKVPSSDIGLWTDRVTALLPALPAPFLLDEVALVGERGDGRFELIQRYALTG